MLPVLPLLVGGALGTVVGFSLKKYFDENDTQNKEKLEDGLMNIEEWLDEKLVVLDRYKDSLNLNKDQISSSKTDSYLQKLD